MCDELCLCVNFKHQTSISVISTYRWCSASHEDYATKIGSTLVRESSGSVDQSTDTIRLNGRADNGRAPNRGGRSGFPRLDELFTRVRPHGSVVGVTEERGHDGQRGGMSEDGAERDGRRLDRREI